MLWSEVGWTGPVLNNSSHTVEIENGSFTTQNGNIKDVGGLLQGRIKEMHKRITAYFQSLSKWSSFHAKSILLHDLQLEQFHKYILSLPRNESELALGGYRCQIMMKQCERYLKFAKDWLKSSVLSITNKTKMNYQQARENMSKSLVFTSIAPILIITGILCNILSVAVLLRKAFRQTTMTFYLITLAIVDTIILNIWLLPKFLERFPITAIYDLSDYTCKFFHFTSMVFLHLSSWIIVHLTAERTAAVVFPWQVKGWFTKMRAATYLFINILILLIVDTHYIWTFYRMDTQNMSTCGVYPQHEYFSLHILPWINMLQYSVIPLTIIAACNTVISVKLYQSYLLRKRSSTTTQNQGVFSNTFAVLFGITISFFVTTSPGTIFEIILNHSEGEMIKAPWFRYVSEILILSHQISSAFNFLLYCLTGGKFRHELVLMFKRQQSPLSMGD